MPSALYTSMSSVHTLSSGASMVARPTLGSEVNVRSDEPDTPCTPDAPVVEMRIDCGGGVGGRSLGSFCEEAQASAPANENAETPMMMMRIFPPGCAVMRPLLA